MEIEKDYGGFKFKVIIPTDRDIWNDVAGIPIWKTEYLMRNTGCGKCAFNKGELATFCCEYTDNCGHLPCYVSRLDKKQMQFTYCSVIDDDCKATVQ